MRKPPDPLSLFPRDADGQPLPGTVRRFPIADIPEALAVGWVPLPVDGWLLWPSTAPLVLPASGVRRAVRKTSFLSRFKNSAMNSVGDDHRGRCFR
jgi:hypothetical protein